MQFIHQKISIFILELWLIQISFTLYEYCRDEKICSTISHLDKYVDHVIDECSCKTQHAFDYKNFTSRTTPKEIADGLYKCRCLENRTFYLRKEEITAGVGVIIHPTYYITKTIDFEYTIIVNIHPYGLGTQMLRDEWLPAFDTSNKTGYMIQIYQTVYNVPKGHNGEIRMFDDETSVFTFYDNHTKVKLKSKFCGTYILTGKSMTKPYFGTFEIDKYKCDCDYTYKVISAFPTGGLYNGYCHFFSLTTFEISLEGKHSCWIGGFAKKYFNSVGTPGEVNWKFVCKGKSIPVDRYRNWTEVRILCKSDIGCHLSIYHNINPQFREFDFTIVPEKSTYNPEFDSINFQVCAGVICYEEPYETRVVVGPDDFELSDSLDKTIDLNEYKCQENITAIVMYNKDLPPIRKTFKLSPMLSPECLSSDIIVDSQKAQKPIRLCLPSHPSITQLEQTDSEYESMMKNAVCHTKYFDVIINGTLATVKLDILHNHDAMIECSQFSCSWNVRLLLKSLTFKTVTYLDEGIKLIPEKEFYNPLSESVMLVVYTKFDIQSSDLSTRVMTEDGKVLVRYLDNKIVLKNYVCLSKILISSMFRDGYDVYNRTINLQPVLYPNCKDIIIKMTLRKAQSPFRLCQSYTNDIKEQFKLLSNYNTMLRDANCSTNYSHITIEGGFASLHLEVPHAHEAIVLCKLNDCSWTVRIELRSMFYKRFNKEVYRCNQYQIKTQSDKLFIFPIIFGCISLVIGSYFFQRQLRRRFRKQAVQKNNAASILSNLTEEDVDILHTIMLNKNKSPEIIHKMYTRCLELHSEENEKDLEIFLRKSALIPDLNPNKKESYFNKSMKLKDWEDVHSENGN